MEKFEIVWHCNRCKKELKQSVDPQEYDFWMHASASKSPYCANCGDLMSMGNLPAEEMKSEYNIIPVFICELTDCYTTISIPVRLRDAEAEALKQYKERKTDPSKCEILQRIMELMSDITQRNSLILQNRFIFDVFHNLTFRTKGFVPAKEVSQIKIKKSLLEEVTEEEYRQVSTGIHTALEEALGQIQFNLGLGMNIPILKSLPCIYLFKINTKEK